MIHTRGTPTGVHTVDFLISISESRPVGNRRSLLQRESTHNEPTNPIYEIRSNIVGFRKLYPTYETADG
ncbi:MAG: hypothetical protein OXI67_09975 [Candidatus Poribacteria bacterium]|nr:hypothetical protein [Candidatus Poribacteria bacterium]